MNPKAKGEKGERIAIGELAKWDIDVAIPLSDNLPWDFIVVYNSKLFKAQVKSSSCLTNGAVEFNLRSSNWYSKTDKKYTIDDCDVMILCDYERIYLLGPDEFSDRAYFTIRCKASRQMKGTNFWEDYVLSKERIEAVFS